MPELRLDPVNGRRIYVAEERAGRPSDYAAVAPRADCPFCAGNEAATPQETALVCDAAGQWQVRVVPNRYPAFVTTAGPPPAVAAPGVDGLLLTPGAALGVHEVIIESPRHVTDFCALGVEQLAAVLGAYRDRLRHWAADSRLRHGIVFKNAGHAAGASLEHVHSQLAVLPYVPDVVADELEGSRRYYGLHRRCVFCDLLARETEAGERVVGQRNGYVALAAYAGRQPFETWILPQRHQSQFEAEDDASLRGLAEALHDLLPRLARAAHRPAYNLMLHSGPFDCQDHAVYHWHWELAPRVSQLAGLELGTGTYINPVSPERAAEQLRAALPNG